MTVTVVLKDVPVVKIWPKIENCKPMIVRGITDETDQIVEVMVRFDISYGFFGTDGTLTYSKQVDWIMKNYEFIRYLRQDESVTFTGE